MEIRYNQALGSDFTLDDLFDREGCNAVVLAIGAHRSRKLGIPGEEKTGVLHGTDFLREVGLINRGGRAGSHPARGGRQARGRGRRRQRGPGRGPHRLAAGRQRGPRHLPAHAPGHAGLRRRSPRRVR